MMKYYKFRSNPLEEITPAKGSHAVDEYGNLLSFDIMGNKALVVNTELLDNIKLNEAFEKPEVALKAFWACMDTAIRKVGYVTRF